MCVGGCTQEPGALKRPRCAYLVFLDRHRPRIRAEHPSMPMKDLVVLQARDWKTVRYEYVAAASTRARLSVRCSCFSKCTSPAVVAEC
jgi:hypothetical protein